MDPNNSDSGVSPTPTISTTFYQGGPAGSGAQSSPSSTVGSPATSRHVFGKHLFSYSGLFRSTKSCSNLEQMNEESSSRVGSIADLSEEPVNITPATSLSFTAPPRYGAMFRSVKSCASLEGMDKPDHPSASHSEQHGVGKESGLLFGSVRSYLAKSNDVSARDLNVMAPMSS